MSEQATEQVTFGSKKALKIVSAELIKRVKAIVEEKIGTSITHKHYVLLNENNISKIPLTISHQVAYNTLGHRYLLLLTTIDDKRCCIFINRKNEIMIIVRFRFIETLFTENTIMDGELIKMESGSWVFLISSSSSQVNIIDSSCFQPDENVDACLLLNKRWFDISHISALENPAGYRALLPYSNSITGLVFKHNDNQPIVYIFPECRKNSSNTSSNVSSVPGGVPGAPVVSGVSRVSGAPGVSGVSRVPGVSAVSGAPKQITSEPVFKIVATDLPDVYELFTKSDSKSVGYASIPDMATSEFVNKLFEDGSKNEIIYVKCMFNEKFEKWVPIGIA